MPDYYVDNLGQICNGDGPLLPEQIVDRLNGGEGQRNPAICRCGHGLREHQRTAASSACKPSCGCKEFRA